jgi:hypothetical protein
MAKNVLLSVDLNSITSDQRTEFNASLAEAQWQKHARLTTVWTARFKDDVDENGAITTTKNDVQRAATKSKIANFDVLIHVGDSPPTEYSKRP